METFVWVVESASFSETACQLDVSLGLASAALQRLEKMLKTPLFTRSTQHAVVRGWGALFTPCAGLVGGAAARSRGTGV
ncbi:helix-turn-helix domain-containing protein [Pseudomonas silesiensis]